MSPRFGMVSLVAISVMPLVSTSVEAAARKPPARSVSASRMLTVDGVTCAYLRTSTKKTNKTKGLQNSWLAGTRGGKKSFIVHADAAKFYKSQGRKFKKQYASAKKKAEQGSKVCNRLTSLRFTTKGFIALGLAEQSTAAKSGKGVRSSSASVPVAGLYGITDQGSISGVIKPIDSADAPVVVETKIIKTYNAPDGFLYAHYETHPNSCVVSRILAAAEREECLVGRSELPVGFNISDGGGYASETTDLIQFDHVGGVYLNLSGPPPECFVNGAANAVDLIMEITPDGSKRVMSHDSCRFRIMSWSPLRSGGVLYSMGAAVTSGHEEGIARILKWRNGSTTLVKSGISLTPNGIQPVSGGKTLINVFDSAPDIFPRHENHQGGILLHDDATDAIRTWFHYADQSPAFAHENLDSIHCDCRTQLPLFQPLTMRDGTLYGVGSLGDIDPPHEGKRSRNYLWRLYPDVKPLIEVPWTPTGQAYSFAAATARAVVLAGPFITSGETCLCSMELVDLTSSGVTNLVKPSDGLSILSLESTNDGSRIVAHAFRPAKKAYLIGLVDDANATVEWTETSSINYRWVMPLAK